ncbi:DNA-3-methyladenine glycosylase 2 family protein [Saccharopolyspora sp. HNM0983]|uniref:DNA-3-methyladenine glycosylase II n=1 Tax=Saccharopolyspora montiporae TaxID=2781240 RepID=A0A929G0I2_9PSEU|nr:AlkA N-terminal domain-containing protein [Saccharopolyspora sp. HNM0983]MBE9375650.1 DNA-3-methyladenine glycosylase 2 family protein [Saccharopolyspora sp. HNM0983]
MLVGAEQARRAVASRDARFDGCFVHAVRSTRIYCRPSCPARTPNPGNSTFFPTAAAAQAAGYRACLRCLPDAVPGSPEWDLRADLAGRAMRLITDGLVDRSGVGGLAAELGYSARQLNRVLTGELGAGPLGLARANRAHHARILIEGTGMAFSDIAFAAGFSSLRQFNDTIREVFASTPGQLRSRRGAGPADPGAVHLRLAFRPPFDAAGVFGFLRDRAVTGLESVTDLRYARSLRLPHGTGTAVLRPKAEHLGCTLHLADLRDLGAAVARLRRLFDLDADPVAVDTALAADPAFGHAVAVRPGIRVPGSVDGLETLVRTVLGQQVSVAVARRGLGVLVQRLGAEIDDPAGAGVHRLFPTAEALAEHATAAVPGPRSRADTVAEAAAAVAGGALRLHPGRDRQELRAELLAVRGIGPWTADCVTMRVLGAPDVLLSGDLALRRGAAALGLPSAPAELDERARRLSPWRSYAGMHLWAAATGRAHLETESS